MTLLLSSSSSSSLGLPYSSSSSSLSGLSVSVTDSEIKEKNKKYTLYKVCVCNGGRFSVTYRRYNEFYTLYEKMKKLIPDGQFKLPGKKLFGNFDAEVIKSRKIGIQEFVIKLISNPVLFSNCDIRSFFNLDISRQSSTDQDELDEAYESSGQSDSTFSTSKSSEKLRAKPNDFEFLKVIGKGSFGKVFLARHKTDDILYAIKVLNKSHVLKRNEVQHIMAERRVLENIVQHPFLVAMKYSFQTPDKLYFVLDYVNGGELFFHLQRERRFSEERGKFYAAEISSALGYLHSLNILYRDLKPENILLDSQGHVTLTDFGLCKEGINNDHKTIANTFCGTPEYLAPEIIQKKSYDCRVDWWCLGAVLYEMLFGLPPFYSRDTNEMYNRILHEPLEFRSNIVTEQAKNILQQLLEKDEEKRLGDVEKIKVHEFFSNIDWILLEQKKVPPPHIPNLIDDMDLRNFDPDFTKQSIPDSVGQSSDERIFRARISNISSDGVFNGFSYVPPIPEATEIYRF